MSSASISLYSRRVIAFCHDVLALGVCWYFAYCLRFNFDLPAEFRLGASQALPLLCIIYAPVFWFSGLYLGIWRYASLMDLRRIIVAVALASVCVATAMLMLRVVLVPRSVLVLHPALLILLMGGSRFLYRAWKDRAVYGRLALTGEPVLVMGSGSAAERLVRELDKSVDWRVVGLLSAATNQVGAELRGVKILGTFGSVAECASRLGVQRVIVAMTEANSADRRQAMEVAVQSGLSVLTVPSLDDMLSGNVSISQLRQVQLEDLLGREPVLLDNLGLHDWLNGKTVLVTGAGGSIGSELARQIVQFKPGLLIMFDLSEFALYQIEQEFLRLVRTVPMTFMVGDVKDGDLLDSLFSRYHPNIVFHAAAYKHVPLMEGENAWQAVRNNVLGSKRLAEAARLHGVDKMVLISTDKAVNPTNVMGASKRLAERVLGGLQQETGTRFITVRFGNVLGSNGSVIPTFREQIARGGPVTVTHPEIIRYFMLIPEASQLVLQAGLMGRGGEIFVLEMGEPIRIADLARDMIRLSGFSEEEIKIEFTGLRPGEKLYEELLTDSEQTIPTPHAKLRVARAEAAPDGEWQHALDEWLRQSAPKTPNDLKRALQEFVPEYSPQLQ